VILTIGRNQDKPHGFFKNFDKNTMMMNEPNLHFVVVVASICECHVQDMCQLSNCIHQIGFCSVED